MTQKNLDPISIVPVEGPAGTVMWSVFRGSSTAEINADTGIVVSSTGGDAVFQAVVGAIEEWCLRDVSDYGGKNSAKIAARLGITKTPKTKKDDRTTEEK